MQVWPVAQRSVPSVLLDPLHEEFGWSHATISAAVPINLLLFGRISPFAAALMDANRESSTNQPTDPGQLVPLGLQKVVSGDLVLIALGSGLTVFMTASWQQLLCCGLLVGVGTGSRSMTFVATITGRWFVHRRGLVAGILTAAGATGQLIFLPPIPFWRRTTAG